MALVKVQGRGQVTIPAKFRDALAIEAGCTLMLQQTGVHRFTVEVIPQRTLGDFPKVDVRVDMDRIREEMGQDMADHVVPDHGPVGAMTQALQEVAAARAREA